MEDRDGIVPFDPDDALRYSPGAATGHDPRISRRRVRFSSAAVARRTAASVSCPSISTKNSYARSEPGIGNDSIQVRFSRFRRKMPKASARAPGWCSTWNIMAVRSLPVRSAD